MEALDFNNKALKLKTLLKNYAYNLTKNLEDAEDLYHDTYLRAFQNREKFSEDTNFRGWLCTIMRNIFINAYRRSSKKIEVFKNTISGEPFYESTATTKIINFAEIEDINKAIEKLRWDYRHCLMKHFEGFKYQEIAEELNVPIGNIKTNIFQARKKLKMLLEV